MVRLSTAACSLAAAAALALAPSVAVAATIQGSLAYSPSVFPDRSACPISAKAVLDAGDKESFIFQDGTFKFEDVEPGFHTLSISCPAYKFAPLLIAVPERGSQPFVSRHNPLKLPPFTLSTLPSADKSLPYPLEISPLGKEEFFEVNKGFEVGSMLKNPMILMMIFSGVIMLGLPYLTSLIDPETLQEANDMLKPAAPSSSPAASKAISSASTETVGGASSTGGAAPAAGGKKGKKARK